MSSCFVRCINLSFYHYDIPPTPKSFWVGKICCQGDWGRILGAETDAEPLKEAAYWSACHDCLPTA